jgi:6-phospho-beta-glucosidase
MKHGLIGQETTGVGGFAKALRTVPVILDICKHVEEYAPHAWMVNFTNPSGIVTEAILRKTRVNCIGLCNVPLNLHIDVAKLLGLPLEKVSLDYVGLNHLAWVRKVYANGRDITQSIFGRSIKGMQPKNIPDMDYPESLLEALGMFPAYYNRYYYMTDKLIAKQQKSKKTRGEEVLEIENRLLKMYSDPRLDKKPAMLSKRGGAYYSKAALDVASSIINNRRDTQTVNVKNNGTIRDFYDDAVIEVPCVIGSNGARPVKIGIVEPHILGIMHHVKAYERITIEAAINRSYNMALLALLTHPLAGGAEKAPRVLDDLNKVHKLGLN